MWREGSSQLMDDLANIKDTESKLFTAAKLELKYLMHFQVLLHDDVHIYSHGSFRFICHLNYIMTTDRATLDYYYTGR